MSIELTGETTLDVAEFQQQIDGKPAHIIIDLRGVRRAAKITFRGEDKDSILYVKNTAPKEAGLKLIENRLKNPSPEISTPHLYRIYMSLNAKVDCGRTRFHEIVDRLTELGVTGFTTWFNSKEGSYNVQINDFDTETSPVTMKRALLSIDRAFLAINAETLR